MYGVKSTLDKIETVQWKAILWADNNYSYYASVTQMQDPLGWHSLEDRWAEAHLILFCNKNYHIVAWIPNIQHEISHDVDDLHACKCDKSVIPWFCACMCNIASYMRTNHGITKTCNKQSYCYPLSSIHYPSKQTEQTHTPSHFYYSSLQVGHRSSVSFHKVCIR